MLYLGWAIAAFGLVLLGVDGLEGMPPAWTLWEGPFVFLFGTALVWLTGQLAVRDTPDTP